MLNEFKKWIVLIIPFIWISSTIASDPCYTLESLAKMPWAELECIYRQAEPGHVPDGFAQGRVIYCPEEFLSKAKSKTSQALWHGKIFCASEGTLINQWCGLRAIRGTISQGNSWLDGKPALILDYSQTSRVWADVRDEMREIAPGLYLGAMYLRRCPEPRLKVYFVLQSCP